MSRMNALQARVGLGLFVCVSWGCTPPEVTDAPDAAGADASVVDASDPPAPDAGVPPGDASTVDPTDGGHGEPDAGPPAASCDGVDCSGRGTCVVDGAVARCECDGGLSPVGPSCLAVSTPDWPLEVAGWNRTRLYPGLPYVTRLAVRGGTYPYRFALVEGPDGLTLDRRTGTIEWTPSSTGTATARVEITDAVGAAVTTTLDLDVSRDGARFVSPSGSDSGDGSEERPWRTLDHAIEAGGPTDTVYVSPGVYSVTGRFGSGSPEAFVGLGAERPVLDFQGSSTAIGRDASQRLLFQGLEVRNGGAKLFWLQGRTSHVVFYRCDLHGVRSDSANNPALIFSEDQGARTPGEVAAYDDIVVQECALHDQTSSLGHGGGAVLYDVGRALFEDNEVYDVDGHCLQDKDDGYRNVFRHNVLHGCEVGVALLNQASQEDTEISYNLSYDVEEAVRVGHQPGWIRGIYVHHNTSVGGAIRMRWSIGNTGSDDINVYANLTVGGPAFTTENPDTHADITSGRVAIDGNLSFSESGTVYRSHWGSRRWTFEEWRSLGFDTDGRFEDPGLDAMHRLPPSSPLRGRFGRD